MGELSAKQTERAIYGGIFMSVKIVLGRSGSGKTSECIAEIEKLSETENNIYYIVPDGFSHESETALTERMGALFEGKAAAITFKRLCSRIFEKSGRASLVPLSAAGKNMLVMRAVYLERKNLSIYKNSADKFGFAKKMTSLISEFKRYGITDEILASLAEALEEGNLKSKLSDILKIYARYNSLFSDEYADSEDDLFFAAAQLTGLDYLNGAHIFIDEFSDFLPGHFAMLEVILKRAASVSFYMCASKPPLSADVFFSCEAKSVERIKELCYRLGRDLKITYKEDNLRYKDAPDLAALEKNYTEYRLAPYNKSCERVNIFESGDIFSELEYVAGQIVMLCRKEGYRFRDICVCAGDMNMYEKAAGMVFNMYSVPYFTSSKETAAENPMVEAICAVLDIFTDGFNYESVFLYLKSGFSNITASEADILENYVLETGIGKKQWLSESNWSFKKDFLSEEDTYISEKADEIRRRVIAPLLKLKEKLGVKNTVKTSAKAIFDFMCEVGMDKKVSAMAEEFKAEGQQARANLFIKTYNGILSVLNQAVTMAGEDKIGIEQFKNILRAGFENENISLIPQTVDEIIFCSAADARAAKRKVMFCIGTNTGEFASLSGEEGVLSDSEREELEKLGICVAPTQRQKLSDSRSIVYRAITGAKEKLYLTYSLSDFEGDAQNGSALCEKVRQILPQVKVGSNADTDKVYPYQYEGKYPAYLNLCVSMAKFASGAKRDEIWSGVYSILSEKEDYSEKIKKADMALNYRNEAKKLDSAVCDKLYRDGITSSVSRLETYRKCPFSYFIEYTLKAKERKILKIGAPDIGTIMHDVLERFVAGCVASGVDWHALTEEQIRSMLLKITADYYGGILKNTSADTKANRYLLNRIEQNLTRCAMLVVNHMRRGAFEPAECEVEFKEGGKIGAVILDITSGKKLKIQGKIDRLDKCETEEGTYYRIVDYKSGSKDFALDRVFYGLDLQLAVYLYAATQSGGKPAGMLYFKIREPMCDSKGGFMDAEQAKRAIEAEMKMDGLVLADDEIISLLDNSGDKKSSILPIAYKNDGSFYDYSKVATAKEFKRIFTHVKAQLKQIGENILKGRCDISPCVHGISEPCKYCKYSAVCRFDEKQDGTKRLKTMKKEEVFESLYKLYGGEEQ